MIGLISDTHGQLDRRVHKIFASVDHILHAGDVCGGGVIAELETIAPVTAVLGNCDHDPMLRPLEIVEIADLKILIHHIVPHGHPQAEIFASVRRIQPDIVLFGHTHKPFDSVIDSVRFINPGSITQGRGGSPRSVATLDCDQTPARLSFHELP